MRKLAVVVCLFVLSPGRAEAWNPIKAAADKLRHAGRAIGGALGVPVGGLIESATTPVVRNVEDAGHRLITDLDRAIAARGDALLDQGGKTITAALDHVDSTLAARILQVQTGLDRTADHAFDRIDVLIGRLESDAQQLLARAELAGKHLIAQLDATAAANLARADQLLAARTQDLQLLVSSSIQQADDVARERLAQLDEVAGRRIGNVDVIVTKQSLSLEGMLVRIAALIGLVGLIAFVAWRLFREAADALALANDQGVPRLRTLARRAVTRLVPQLALAAAGALVLYWASTRLPDDANRRALKQVQLHQDAFARAERALDVIEARYQASQLEILASEMPSELIGGYRAHLKKIELLHSVFTRPGQLHTAPGLANLVAQVGEVEAAFKDAGQPLDPDVIIAKAYVLWQVGGTRDDEYEAATLCASALAPGSGAQLAPLARNYITAFLADPYVPHDGASRGLDELELRAGMAPGEGETGQFDPVIELNQLVKNLDRASTAAYLDMIAAQAELRIARAAQSRGPEPAAARAARAARTAAANRLIEAWASFDRTLDGSTTLASVALSVFTLDDAVLSRARYYAAVPEANDLAPMLTARPMPASLTPALRARIAPLRVAWEQRYAPLLGPHARTLVSYEEAQRFAAFEQRAAAFESAYLEFAVAARTGVAPAKLLELGSTAATRAAGMGLYRDTDAGRITEASRILAIAGKDGQRASPDVIASIELNYRVRRLRFL